jgi:hypothetical protein
VAEAINGVVAEPAKDEEPTVSPVEVAVIEEAAMPAPVMEMGPIAASFAQPAAQAAELGARERERWMV